MKNINLLFLSVVSVLVTASSIDAQLEDFSEAPAYKVLGVVNGDTGRVKSCSKKSETLR